MSSEPFLDAALGLGRRLCDAAIWHAGACSWMGAAGAPAIRSRPEYRAVGPRLYDGTAGIGLFLARLDDAAARRTAAGALRHALTRAMPEEGFHTGSLGIAWAAAHVGALLDDDALTAGADELTTATVAALSETWEDTSSAGPDLVDGRAGTLLGLLALGRADTARAVSATLLATATVTRHGAAWTHPTRRTPHPLCGLAHGAAGIGWALLELYAATGDAAARTAAEQAFAYERSWLHAPSGTWPDLRLPARRGQPAQGSNIIGSWCYGEAGIALSRLRANAVLGLDPICPDTDISLATTERHVLDALPYAFDDLSLCHGLGGAADVLLGAGRSDPGSALGEAALTRYGRSGDWPCGIPGTTPDLFRGWAGIGWLFLRLHDSGIPSPLAVDSPPDAR